MLETNKEESRNGEKKAEMTGFRRRGLEGGQKPGTWLGWSGVRKGFREEVTLTGP